MSLSLVTYELQRFLCIFGVVSAQLFLLAQLMIKSLKKDTPQKEDGRHPTPIFCICNPSASGHSSTSWEVHKAKQTLWHSLSWLCNPRGNGNITNNPFYYQLNSFPGRKFMGFPITKTSPELSSESSKPKEPQSLQTEAMIFSATLYKALQSSCQTTRLKTCHVEVWYGGFGVKLHPVSPVICSTASKQHIPPPVQWP